MTQSNTENDSTFTEAEELSNNLVVLSDILPDHLVILPMPERPIFPGITMPMIFSGKKYIDSLKVAQGQQPAMIGVVFIKERNDKDIFQSELYRVGTTLKIFRLTVVSEDTVQVMVQGVNRFSCKRNAPSGEVPLRWEVKYHNDPEEKPSDELKAYSMAIISSVKDLLRLNPIFGEQLKMIITQISLEKPGLVMDAVASLLSSGTEKLQEILEAFDLYERGYKLLMLLREEKELLQLQQRIKNTVDEQISKQQKDFFLREQLKIIKKELGIEKDGKDVEIEKIEQRLQKLELPEEAARVIRSELDRLKMLEPISPEFNVSRTYLEVLTDLPWGVYSEDIANIHKAREVLEAEHYGLEDVKARILEFISTIIKRGKITGSNILLVGPPGVGKTSIGKSIASALGRKFYRFSVGGMRDEAEIKGHRRTYIGAMPGKLIESLRRSGTANPVIMLDELDKMGVSYQGDPGSALLEVLDPEQNHNFLDHYLDVRFDLSNVLFIATANQLDTIPGPLLDRMEIIHLAGYILEEKVAIAKRYLIPRQQEEHGLTEDELHITEEALSLIIDRYAREAGVRNLENQIKKIMRHVTLKLAEGEKREFVVKPENLEEYLGKPLFTTEELYNRGVTGAVLGLAYTPLGGATLYIEANAIKSRNTGFKQTGQLGKVMQESAEIAYSYVRATFTENQVIKNFFDENMIHLHVPAGATPKDGPSAGITMALALYSLAMNKPIREDLAMTGELTLTGKVLPIGGVKEKTIAARRVGVKEIILPLENKKDFEELPSYVREGLMVHFAYKFEDVLRIACS
jgi:ATP-dependent Lon protease